MGGGAASGGATSSSTSSAASSGSTQSTSGSTSQASSGASTRESGGSGGQERDERSTLTTGDSGSAGAELKGDSAGAKPKEGGQQAADKAAAKALKELEAEALEKVVKVKVNGKEEVLTVKEAIEQAQRAKGYGEKMREAAEIRKAQEAFHRALQADPMKVIEHIAKERGLDLDEIAEKRLEAKLRQMEMTPEQRELETLKTQKAQWEAEQKQRAEYAKHLQQQEIAKKAKEAIDKELGEAFESAGLPKHEFYQQHIAHEMFMAAKRGEQLTAKEAAAKVKERTRGSFQEFLKAQDAAAIREFIGEEIAEKLRQFEVQRVTGKGPSPLPNSNERPPESTGASRTQRQPKVVDEAGWQAWLEGKKKSFA